MNLLARELRDEGRIGHGVGYVTFTSRRRREMNWRFWRRGLSPGVDLRPWRPT